MQFLPSTSVVLVSPDCFLIMGCSFDFMMMKSKMYLISIVIAVCYPLALLLLILQSILAVAATANLYDQYIEMKPKFSVICWKTSRICIVWNRDSLLCTAEQVNAGEKNDFTPLPSSLILSSFCYEEISSFEQIFLPTHAINLLCLFQSNQSAIHASIDTFLSQYQPFSIHRLSIYHDKKGHNCELILHSNL